MGNVMPPVLQGCGVGGLLNLVTTMVPPHTVRGLRFSVARVCAYVRVGIYGGMGGGMRSRSHLYFSCFSLVICLYSSENGIGDPDPNISAFS